MGVTFANHIMKFKPFAENIELRNAVKILWVFSAVLSVAIFLVFFLIEPNLVFQNMPSCEYKLQNTTCFLCVTTRAFYKIKEFDFESAYKLNRLSIFACSIMLINISVVTIYFIKNLKKI